MSQEVDFPPPRANPQLFGHDEAEGALAAAFAAGRLAHAWLISGPRGIGKATLAFRFARFVLARGRRGEAKGALVAAPANGDLAIDPGDPVFRRVASGGHADLMTVERGLTDEGKRRTEIVVEDVRGIGGFLRLTPAEGGWRVVVVDCADDLNRHAANALLKALEEPTARSLLLLVSHSPGTLLPTIRSRCRRLALRPLSEPLVDSLLARLRPGLDAEKRRVLARLSEGSLGRALTLADEGEVVGLLEALPDIDGAALHGFCDRLARPGSEAAFGAACELLRSWLARLVAASARAAPDAQEVGEDAAVQRLAAAGSLDRWLDVWDKINRILARAEDANLDRKQVILNAFLALESAARR